MAFELSRSLCGPAERGDLGAVQQFVEAGADVNSVGDHGMGAARVHAGRRRVPAVAGGRSEPPDQRERQSCADRDRVPEPARVRGLLLAAGADPKAVVKDPGGRRAHGAGRRGREGDAGRPPRGGQAAPATTARPRTPRTIPGVPSLRFSADVRTRGETPLHRAAAYAAGGDGSAPAGRRRRPDDPDGCNGDSPQSWASWRWRAQTPHRPARPAGRADCPSTRPTPHRSAVHMPSGSPGPPSVRRAAASAGPAGCSSGCRRPARRRSTPSPRRGTGGAARPARRRRRSRRRAIRHTRRGAG